MKKLKKKIEKIFWGEKIDFHEILTNFDQSLTESSEKFKIDGFYTNFQAIDKKKQAKLHANYFFFFLNF